MLLIHYLAGADGAMTVARDEGSPERLGGALRRLHYKATRRAHSAAARHHNNTPPKVRLLINRLIHAYKSRRQHIISATTIAYLSYSNSQLTLTPCFCVKVCLKMIFCSYVLIVFKFCELRAEPKQYCRFNHLHNIIRKSLTYKYHRQLYKYIRNFLVRPKWC